LTYRRLPFDNFGPCYHTDLYPCIAHTSYIASRRCSKYLQEYIIKVKVWALASATYTSQTRDQQRFTISEVAADWHEHCEKKLARLLLDVGVVNITDDYREHDDYVQINSV